MFFDLYIHKFVDHQKMCNLNKNIFDNSLLIFLLQSHFLFVCDRELDHFDQQSLLHYLRLNNHIQNVELQVLFLEYFFLYKMKNNDLELLIFLQHLDLYK